MEFQKMTNQFRRNLRIADEANRLLKGECNPRTPDNLSAAMAYATLRQRSQLAAALAQRDYEEAGRLLNRITQAHWNNDAYRRAAYTIDKETQS